MSGFCVMIYNSAITNESRIIKQSQSLIASKKYSKILILGRHDDSNIPDGEKISNEIEIHRIRLVLNKYSSNAFIRTLKFCEWFFKLYQHTKKCKINLLVAHSLMALLPSVIIKKYQKNSYLHYDAHELETERGQGKLFKVFLRFLEKKLIKRADSMTVVSESIASWYEENYQVLKPTVVLNCPSINSKLESHSNYFKNKLNIPDDNMLFIFLGSFAKGRGIDLLLKVFSELKTTSRNKHIVFVGYGLMKERIEKYSLDYSNIHYHPAIPIEKVLELTSSADVGCSMFEDFSLSYRYCLPNKLFEYLFSGLPVVVSDTIEQKNFVNNHGCGWVVPSEKCIDNFTKFVDDISFDEIFKFQENISKVSSEVNWEKESKKFLELLNIS